jgi:TRAP-type mannitol/chloroaromatic compound transport system permease small subunit
MADMQNLPTGIPVLDGSLRLLDRLTVFSSILGTLGILSIMVLIVADVVGRFVFDHPIAGVPEMVAMSILAIVFLQIGNTLVRGRLTRADGFLNLLRDGKPRLGALLDGVMNGAGAAIIMVLISAFYPLFLRSYGRNEMVGAVGQFLAPIWPVHLIVLIGCGLLAAVFLLRAIILLLHAIRGPVQ